MKSMNIIKHPLSTEKSVRVMEAENKLVFVVHRQASKKQIKDSIEKRFNVKVMKVNTFIDTKGRKRAYVQFSEETPAIDIATRMGVM